MRAQGYFAWEYINKYPSIRLSALFSTYALEISVCDFIWKSDSGRCDSVQKTKNKKQKTKQNKKTPPYWIRVSPNARISFLIRWWNFLHRQTDCRATLPQSRNTKDCWQPPEAMRAKHAFTLRPLVEVQLSWHYDSKLLASATIREKKMHFPVSHLR